MGDEERSPPRLYHNLFEGCVVARGEGCGCLSSNERRSIGRAGLPLHIQEQDTTCRAWQRLLELIEEAAVDGREVFDPAKELGGEAWSEIVTLPPTISKLTQVKRLQLYGSLLLRIPPEIGDMASLEIFTPYTSYSLHWLPYEITRCRRLKDSTISTRALYGNLKDQLPFPKLPVPAQVLTPPTCSVCGSTYGRRGPMQRWTSQRVATDVVPLLVHACSRDCLEKVPTSPEGYPPRPHRGGC